MKIVNKDAYKLIKKEDNTFYDILLCSTCSQTCMRCNFSRHKKSPKHLRELDKNNIPVVSFSQNTSSVVVDEKVGNLSVGSIEDKIAPLYM